MQKVVVDQIGPDGELLLDVDPRLSEETKSRLLLEALPGAVTDVVAGVRVVRFRDQVILKKQVTHLGRPWPGFKKRIQIPRTWLEVERQASASDLQTRFVGIYHYCGVTIFVDFDPARYLRQKANNSAAHVATNDLHQAQVNGQFRRVDRSGNVVTSVRADSLQRYLIDGYDSHQPRLDVFRAFSSHLFSMGRIDALTAVNAMHEVRWPDRFQGEWPGFFLEYEFDRFVRTEGVQGLVEFQKVKANGRYDYDLVFKSGATVAYYGDLKASDVVKQESPGNDAEDFARCLAEFGRFWYVVYEHETVHARDNGDVATIAWNEWRRSAGHLARKGYNPLSYARRFKESVRFTRMSVLEVNDANAGVVLGEFAQGQQPDGAARALKVMIKKRNVDNFLIYSHTVDQPAPSRS
ncbi:hypothetical protein EEW87_015715 [Janibacter melonis]|uniref:Methylase-associated X1 domain-containing protein n=1 Tax=Janibacter melonis TaxID=262209 RepID=A0A5P8FPF7_9MICO|nr:hypothetical protein EEW87_015715 [Janibacter melonis]